MTFRICWNWLWDVVGCYMMIGRYYRRCVLNLGKLWFIVRDATVVYRNETFISCDIVLRLVIISQIECIGDCCVQPSSRSSWKKGKSTDKWQSLLIKSRPPKWICKDTISVLFLQLLHKLGKWEVLYYNYSI